MGGISLWQLIIILLIVLLLFGTKRLRGFGGDLGNAIKGFRKAVQTEDDVTMRKEGDAAPEAQDSAASAASAHDTTSDPASDATDARKEAEPGAGKGS